MEHIVITLDTPDIEALEKQGDKEAVAKVHNGKINFIIVLSVGI